MNEESIKERVDNFQKGFHETHREIYETLHDNQNPHTLFIGCSDSRILPDQILQSVPGEVFMLRNVGNMMPPFEKRQDYPSPVSSMEYAVKVLKVEKIIIKGHNDCGGCATMMMDPEILKDLPQTLRWLELGPKLEDAHRYNLKGAKSEAQTMEWLNILHQMEHLRSYPWIAELEQQGKLEILGWYYHIAKGELFQYSQEKGFFPISI